MHESVRGESHEALEALEDNHRDRRVGAAGGTGVWRESFRIQPNLQSFPDPGTVNYIEGAVEFNGDMLINRNVTINEIHSGAGVDHGQRAKLRFC